MLYMHYKDLWNDYSSKFVEMYARHGIPTFQTIEINVWFDNSTFLHFDTFWTWISFFDNFNFVFVNFISAKASLNNLSMGEVVSSHAKKIKPVYLFMESAWFGTFYMVLKVKFFEQYKVAVPSKRRGMIHDME